MLFNESRGFKGRSANPMFLRRMGMLAILLSIPCIGVGVANVMTKLLKNPNSSQFTKASVAIWTPLPMFVTGILAMYVADYATSSKRWVGMMSFFSALVCSPILIAITSLEFMYNSQTGLDNTLPIVILIFASVLTLVTFCIMVLIYFCTYSEGIQPLVENEAALPTTEVVKPNCGCQNHYLPASAEFKVMPLIPSNYTVLPPAQTFATNIPAAYYNAATATRFLKAI